MGCGFYNYLYTQEIKDKKYTVTIISNLYENNSKNKKKFSLILNENIIINNTLKTKDSIKVNDIIENNPFPFVKIKPKKSKSYK